ncbi:MAG TPA: TetR/AcrR family transcriptional regulator [Candidatus Margulisbacteria bacterium]|nr:MAG: TetR family transcriptional regulator [Candidatus Margulisbacteria bacterium GWD2_39_127]HAR63555.1 TetR/AcrR family transcriptional regulator [Candidatus Margulisiibacteriota bacterium]
MDNKTKILKVALNLFSMHGYEAVGVQEIAVSSGITKPTLYHYYGNKEGLLKAILTEHFDKLCDSVRNAAYYNGDLPFTLEKSTLAFFHFAKENPIFYRLQLTLWFAPPNSESFMIVASFHKELHVIIEKMFMQAAHNHGNMTGRQQSYAFTYLGMVNSYIMLGLNGYTELDEQLVYTALRQFQYGIYS